MATLTADVRPADNGEAVRHRPTEPRATIPSDLDPGPQLNDPQRLSSLPELTLASRAALDHLAGLAAAVLDGERGHVALLHADHLRSIHDGQDHKVVIGAFVIALGEPLMLGDLREEPRTAGSLPVESGFLAYAGTPLRLDGERVGVLSVMSRRARAWTIGDAERLDTLGELGGHLLALP